MAGSAIPPCPVPVVGTLRSSDFGQSGFRELLAAGSRCFPLSPFDVSESTPYPAVEFIQDSFGLRRSKVVYPAPQQRVQILSYKATEVSTPPLSHQHCNTLADNARRSLALVAPSQVFSCFYFVVSHTWFPLALLCSGLRTDRFALLCHYALG